MSTPEEQKSPISPAREAAEREINNFFAKGIHYEPGIYVQRAISAAVAEVTRERDELREWQKSIQAITTTERETVRECLELMKNYQSGGEDVRDLLDLVKDWIAAEALLDEGEYEGADGLEDVVRWLRADLSSAKELLREIRDGEVNPEDEADKFLRDHQPSELSKV